MRAAGAPPPGRVLMTADTVGGVWTHAVELASALSDRGVRVELATMGALPTAAQRAQVDALPRVTLHASAWRLEWMEEAWSDVARAGDWLLDLERRLSPDVVHLNQYAFGRLPFVAPTLVVGHSCVLSWWRAVLGTTAPDTWDRYRDMVASGLAQADLVGAPTRSMLEALRADYASFEGGVVLHNGCRHDRWRPAEKLPYALSVGRLWDPAKNVEALEAVAPALPWPLCVAGSRQGPDGHERPVQAVRWLGELEPEALARCYAHASLYVLPARYEPFGLSALEAALSGCALVLGDIPSLREVWGPAARYVPPDDREALRETVAALVADEAERHRLAAQARLRAIRYTADAMADRYLAAYVAAARRRTARAAMEAPCAS
jgi:glycogen synthase